ncbi:camphor resistance protein CrcB [Roseovarius sp. A-2]|nr:camphor resistance protein CrcB [Roseovarius sp. A-2]
MPPLRATDAAMMLTFLQVALGGAIGACLRFGVGLAMLRVAGPGFPLGVLTVNVLGSFLMGVIMMLSFHRGFDHLNAFLMTGVLGGFTTFSAFSLEAFTLYERGQIVAAWVYVGLSVLLSLMALVLGVWLTRGMAT